MFMRWNALTKYITISSLCAMALMSYGITAVADDFVPLFNGKDIDGWVKHGGEATYKVENGEIVGKRGDGPNTFLCPPKEYGNFILKFECRFDIPINSGVQFRSHIKEKGDVIYGYQAEIDQDTGNCGRVYDESRRGRWISNIGDDVTKGVFKKGEWNAYVIQCVGPSIKIWVNGTLCSDFFDVEDLSGLIGLQVHGSPDDGQVRWRNLMIKELEPSEWVKLFKNKEFEGLWVSPAGKWEMDNDGIVRGTSYAGETRDGMLRCDEIYQDLAARVTFKQIKGNSGLYFRAAEVDKPYWMRGFQDEIDGAATASLWEVEGRGWVARNFEEAEKAFQKDEWNTVSIVAVGDRLVTNLNGQQIIDIVDPECMKAGKVAIQLHGNSDMEYFYRDFEVLKINAEQRKLIDKTVLDAE